LHRDEFNEVTRAELVDDYARALADFRKKFGAGAELRRAIARPARQQSAAAALSPPPAARRSP
jgi:hypothetical protein